MRITLKGTTLSLVMGFLILPVLFFPMHAAAQTVKWVDQAGGSDANDGNSEATAYATLQFAINNSTSGTAGTPSIINVKNGTYAATGLNIFIYSTATLISGLDYLTIQAVPGHNPVVKPASGGVVSIGIENSDHLVIDNIDSDQTTSLFDNMHVRDSADLTVRNCTFEGGDDGIDFETSHTKALITGNTFKNIVNGSGDEVLDFTDASYADVTIQDNTFLNNYRQITIFPPVGNTASNFVIRRNFMDGTTSQEAVRFNDSGGLLSDVTLENNVIMNSMQQGLYIKAPVASINVWHNTFYNNGEEDIRLTGTATAVVIKNNIFHGNGTHAAISVTSAFAPGPLALEDFNLIYDTGSSTESASEFPVTVFGANTITGIDPMFVSTVSGSEDLHLQDGSPALAAGTDLGVSDDNEKNPRPLPSGSNPDLGAYEKGAAAGGGECGDFVFLAEDEIFLDRHGASEGDIHANNDIVIRKGAPSTLSGNLTAVDNIRIQTKNTINGDVTAGGEVDSDVSVNGTVTEHAAVSAVSLPNPSFSAGGANHTVPQNGSLSLAPGTYGIVMVGKNATLNLSSGEYFFTMLDAKQGADLAIDVSGGEVAINVVSKLTFGKQTEVVISSGEAGSSEVTFTSLQSSQLVIGEKAKVLGSIIAPEATVMLSKNSRFRGSICADQVKVSKAAVFLHHSSAVSLPRVFDAPDLEEVESEVVTTVVTDYELSANYPNPFNPSTTIRFALPEAGKVVLRIYSLTGQLVQELVNSEMRSGRHSVSWNGRNRNGSIIASGAYFYRIEVHRQYGEALFTQTRRMTFVK